MATVAKPPTLVVLQLTGGNDPLNTVIPYGNPLYWDNRPTVRIPEQEILHIDNTYGLHPSMAAIKPFWDEGKLAILALVIIAAGAILLAVGTQLALARELHGTQRAWHVLLAVVTVLTSWLFTQVLFAFHYAHDFYLARVRGERDPLEFPGTADPTYGDFFHFSCVIGTSGQTADISFMGSAMRPVGTVHCIVAFFFNASLIALSINVVAGSFL
jgi:uncharacterized membrane protein